MNMLNSILIEGNVSFGPTKDISGNVNFYIRNKLLSKECEEKIIYEENSFLVIVKKEKLKENYLKYLYIGGGIRIVGKMKNKCYEGSDGCLKDFYFIEAENIELKPKYK